MYEDHESGPAIYESTWRPKRTALEWASLIVPRVIFPPILLWDLLKLNINGWLGQWAGTKILEAQVKNCPKISIPHKSKSNSELTYHLSRVVTYDKCRLETLEIKHNDTIGLDIREQAYVVHFGSNGGSCDDMIDAMQDDAKALKCNVLGFDYRGVAGSTGKPREANDLVVDGITQVQRLIDAGVDPKKIMIKGYSLGGGIGTLVAKYFHDHGQKVRLFNNRSFSNLTNVAVGWIRTDIGIHKNGHKESILGIIGGYMAKPLIKIILSLAKWEIEAAEAYVAIPDDYKEHVYVRTSKEKRKADPEIIDDTIISNYAALHNDSGVKSQDQQKKRAINAIAKSESSESLNHINAQQARKQLKDRKIELFVLTNDNEGHAQPLDYFKCRGTGTIGTNFFYNFFKRTCGAQAMDERKDKGPMVEPLNLEI